MNPHVEPTISSGQNFFELHSIPKDRCRFVGSSHSGIS